MKNLVVVKFRAASSGRNVPGRILLDEERRTKIAFVGDRAQISNPSPGSIWRCVAFFDTKPNDRQTGALMVEPIHRLPDFLGDELAPLLNFRALMRDCRNRKIICGSGALRQLAVTPHLAKYLHEAIEQLDIDLSSSKSRSQLFTVDVGEVIGSVLWRKAPTIRAEEEALFAYALGHEHPVRIIISDSPPRSTEGLWLRFSKSHRREEIIFLNSLSYDKPPRRSPMHAETDQEEAARLAFWLEHAFLYNPATMGKPFTSSWEELLEYELDNDELRPEAEVREQPEQHTAIPVLQ